MNLEQPNLLAHLHWIGHDSFWLDSPSVLYIDPWRMPAGSPAAEIILVSHEHHDHFSPDDIARILKPDTRILASAGAAQKIGSQAEALNPGETRSIGPVKIETVPAYNREKSFHPRAANHLGFIIEIAGERLYFAGDTDFIPEMEDIECDIALLPVSGTYVMDADEAAQAASVLMPKVAIPMHYGAGVAGTEADAFRFKETCPVPVTILAAGG